MSGFFFCKIPRIYLFEVRVYLASWLRGNFEVTYDFGDKEL